MGTSHICVRQEDGSMAEERREATHRLGHWLSGRAPARVVLETCNEAFTVADLVNS